MSLSRKEFMKTLGAGALSSGLFLACNPASTENEKTERADESADQKPVSLNLGLTSYSTRKLSLEETISLVNQLGLEWLSLKSMHMPLDSPEEEIKSAAQKVRSAGINLYGAGVIYMKSEEEVVRAFQYAKMAGLQVVIGVPNYDLLELTEQQVQDTGIRLAIHNHGPGDDLYASPDDVMEKIQDMDPKMGLCIDVGHTFRIGQDPAAKIKQYKDRLYDIHLKDVSKQAADGYTVELGRGVMDIPSIMQALHDIGYEYTVALEYEKDGDAPVPGICESIGYARGLVTMMS